MRSKGRLECRFIEFVGASVDAEQISAVDPVAVLVSAAIQRRIVRRDDQNRRVGRRALSRDAIPATS